MNSRESQKNWLVIFLVLISFLFTSNSAAAGKGKSENSEKPKPVSTGSIATTQLTTWILPSSKSNAPILVQAGRTVPMRFKIAVNQNLLTTIDTVKLSLNSLTKCSSDSTLEGTPVILVTPTPAPTVSASSSTSTSTTSKENNNSNILKVENSIFIYNWKIPKNQTSGCYVLIAESNNIKLLSPILRVKGSK